MADAKRAQRVGGLVAETLDIGKGQRFFVAFVVTPDERTLIRFDMCPLIHNIVSKIEILRHDNPEILLKILVG